MDPPGRWADGLVAIACGGLVFATPCIVAVVPEDFGELVLIAIWIVLFNVIQEWRRRRREISKGGAPGEGVPAPPAGG